MRAMTEYEDERTENEDCGLWIELAKIICHKELDPYEGWLYVHLMSLAGADLRPVIKSVRELATISKMSKSQANNKTQSLVKKGLIYFGTADVDGRPVSAIFVCDIWGENAQVFPSVSGKRKRVRRGSLVALQRPYGGQPVHTTDTPVHTVDAVSIPRTERPYGGQSVHTVDSMIDHNQITNKPTEPTKELSSSSLAPSESDDRIDDDDDGIESSWIAEKFNALSNGGKWKHERDFSEWKKIAHLPGEFIVMGLCWSVTRSSEHSLGSLKYAVPVIQRYANHLGAKYLHDGDPTEELIRMAWNAEQEALENISSGKWLMGGSSAT